MGRVVLDRDPVTFLGIRSPPAHLHASVPPHTGDVEGHVRRSGRAGSRHAVVDGGHGRAVAQVQGDLVEGDQTDQADQGEPGQPQAAEGEP